MTADRSKNDLFPGRKQRPHYFGGLTARLRRRRPSVDGHLILTSNSCDFGRLQRCSEENRLKPSLQGARSTYISSPLSICVVVIRSERRLSPGLRSRPCAPLTAGSQTLRRWDLGLSWRSWRSKWHWSSYVCSLRPSIYP